MLFNSVEFLVFFPLVVLGYFLTPARWRWTLLLGASYWFYMAWRPEFVLLIMASTAVDYWAGLRMGAQPDRARRRVYLLASLAANLGLLGAFKYLDFFGEAANATFRLLGLGVEIPAFHLILPLGISFYTFQTLSYSIDVYRGAKTPERHLGIFALYVTFFPQLVAGPIERATHLLPQFFRRHRFDRGRIANGLMLMLWGFFKKVVIADRLAVVVDEVYGQPADFEGLALWVATYAFAFQIYCDFSGYSDIAIGAAQVLGFDLMANFKRPYFAKSIADFWRRWHISLSTWFRDYLYIPLGGNRVARGRWFVNLFVVFLVSGLWHGANWTFVAWGALHGGYLLVAIWTQRARRALARWTGLARRPLVHKLWRVAVTFHLVVFAWIFFRAESLGDAGHIVAHLFSPNLDLAVGLSPLNLLLAALLVAAMEGVHLLQRRRPLRAWLGAQPRWARWAVYYAVILIILLFGKFSAQEFIYFQF